MKNKEIEILIKHRLDQAHEALDDAKYLIDGNRSPQSIVNRSYYAMFYATLALLQKITKVPTKHSGVISLFDKEFVMKGIFPKYLGRSVNKAFDLRIRSDYREQIELTRNQVEPFLGQAKKFIGADRDYLMNTGHFKR